MRFELILLALIVALLGADLIRASKMIRKDLPVEVPESRSGSMFVNFFRAVAFRFLIWKSKSKQAKDASTKLWDEYLHNPVFRRVYNILFFGPGKGWLDRQFYNIAKCGYAKCIGLYVLALCLCAFLFGGITWFSQRFHDTWISQSFRAALLVDVNDPLESESISVFFNWLCVGIFSTIFLSVITRKMVERNPNIVFPEKVYFDPNAGTFNFWLWNRDAARLTNIKYELRLTLTFQDETARDRFASGQDASVFAFDVAVRTPPKLIKPMMGMLVYTIPLEKLNQEGINPVRQRTGNENGSERNPWNVSMEDKHDFVQIDVGTKYVDATQDGTDSAIEHFVCSSEKNRECDVSFELVVHAWNDATGEESVFIHEYSLIQNESLVCGISRDLNGIDNSLYPRNWYDRNMFHMQVVDEIKSAGYKERLDAEGKKYGENKEKYRLKVENCKSCKYNIEGRCSLKDKYPSQTPEIGSTI